MGFFETLKHKSAAKKAGLTYEQYLEFLAMAAEKGYSLDDYRMHLKAVECNMTDEQYREYVRDFSTLRPEEYLHFYKARSEGLSVKAYDVYLAEYQQFMSAVQYGDYLKVGESDMSIEEYIAYLKNHPQSNADALELYITTQKAQKLNMSVSQYREYIAKYCASLSAEQYLMFCDARSIGLSLEQFLEYWRSYRDQYTLGRYYQYCQAQKENLSLDQYDEWKKDYSSLSAARFRNLLEARKQNMTLEAYEELQSARQLGLTVEEYREKKLADSLGIRVENLPFYRACKESQEKGKNFVVVSSLDEVKVANKLQVKKIILIAEQFKRLPYRAFAGCHSFKEIVLPWGIQEIGQYAFASCTALETITIPGSVKSLPRGVFDGCRSLRIIELLSGIEKVDITGWAELPSLKTVASAGSIREFVIDKSRNYHKFSRNHWNNVWRRYDYHFDQSRDYGEESVMLNRVRNSVEILELEDERSIWSLENFPRLKVLILNTKNFEQFGLDHINNCPQLHTIIINGADQTDYYTKSGSLRKRVEYKKELYVSAEGILNQLKFLIVKSDLLRISGGMTRGADGTYRDNVYSHLSWLHVPSETESISIKAPNLSEIGVSNSCYVGYDSVKRLLINEYISKDSDVLMALAVDTPVYETSFAGTKKDTGKKREKLLVYRLDNTYSNGKYLECKDLVVYEGVIRIPKEFFAHGKFEKVSLPLSLQTIESSAFGWCESLKHIELQKVPDKIADDAFYNCNAVEKFTGVSLLEAKMRMNLPHLSLQKLNDIDFTYFSSVIPKSLFAGCAITELVIPAKIKTIEKRAFADIKTLTSITFSGTMKMIAANAFEGCTAVTEVIWKKPGLFKLAGAIGFPNVEKIVLPKGTQTIPESCFANWGLCEIVIPESVTVIENRAFANCKNLKSIVFQGRPEQIAEDAFEGCTNVETIEWGDCRHFCIAGKTGFPKVKEIILPKGTKTIPEACFANWGLCEIVIPESVTIIESRAFANCKNLKSVVFQGNPDQIAEDAFEGCTAVETIEWGSCTHFHISGKTGFPNITQMVIPNGATDIPENCFKNWGIQNIAIPQTVASIGKKAFEGCPISTINGENGVLRLTETCQIASNAFSKCTFQTVIFDLEEPDKLVMIAKFVGATEIVVRDTIGIDSFNQILSISDITSVSCIKTDEPVFVSMDEIQDIPATLQSLELPRSIGKLNFSIFDGCEALTTLIIPESVEQFLFEKCLTNMNLQEITVPADMYDVILKEYINPDTKVTLLGEAHPEKYEVTAIGEDAHLPEIDAKDRLLIQKLIIPEYCLSILDAAFDNLVNLRVVEIKAPIQNVGAKAFFGCIHLEQIELPDSVDSIGEETFAGCSALRQIKLPHGITKIEARTFAGCSSLQAISIPQTVSVIDDEAFEECSSLRDICLPDALQQMGLFAFAGSGIKKVHIPDGIKRLPYGVFSNCAALIKVSGMQNVGYVDTFAFGFSGVQDLIFSEEIFVIQDAFEGCSDLKRILVPVNIAKFSVNLSGCGRLKDLYLPQQIDEFSCYTDPDNSITVHARRGSAWRQRINVHNVNYIKNAEYDELIRIELEKAGLHRSTEPEMQMPAIQNAKKQPAGQVSGTPHKRASWNTRSSTTAIEEVFTAGPATVDELLEKLQTNTAEQPYVIESVDCGRFAAPVATSVEKANIYVSEETKVITNNIFSITLKYREKMFPDMLCVVLVDRNGTPVSDLKKVCSIQNSCESIDVQLQLNTGTANGDYFLMALSQATSDSDVLCADKCTVDVAFAADVDFGF